MLLEFFSGSKPACRLENALLKSGYPLCDFENASLVCEWLIKKCQPIVKIWLVELTLVDDTLLEPVALHRPKQTTTDIQR